MILLPSIFHGILGMITISVIAFSLMVFPNAFAEESQIWQISIIDGASNPDIEKAFLPNELPVNDGDFVEWVNDDVVAHSVTSGLPDHSDYHGHFFEAGLIEPGESKLVEIKIQEGAESFYYVCEIHPWMTGKIFVSGTVTSLPETVNPIKTERFSYQSNDKIQLSGQIHQDFWGTDYEILVYNDENQLLDILNGEFDEESKYSQLIDTNNFVTSGKYTIKMVYALPSKVAETQFDFLVTKTSSDNSIPTWIKNVGEYWCTNEIKDIEFVNAIQFLIQKNIISVEATSTVGSGEHKIPSWVKSNTCWWSDNQITDVDFLSGIEFLVNKGTIRV